MIEGIKQIGSYQYSTRCLLGEGAFGKVYKGSHLQTGEAVAIKKLDLMAFEKDAYMKQALSNEIAILKKFDSPHVVRFHDLITNKTTVYIVTEFCQDGDLRDYMRAKRLSEVEVIGIAVQIVRGFKALYQNGVIHRDLKPANILNDKGTIKIADFGFAKHVDNYSHQLLRSCVGSPLYMAPQVLSRQPYTTKCDVWSLGVIYYEMLFNAMPWMGRHENELLNNIKNHKLQIKQCSPFSEEFLRLSLAHNEADRSSWERVFELFDAQEKLLSNNLKQKYNFQELPPEPIVDAPAWITNNNRNFVEVNKTIKGLTTLRQEVQFRHFVNIEMFAKQQFCKRFVKRELAYEQFYTLLSKLLMVQTKVLVDRAQQLPEGVIPSDQIATFVKGITKDHQFASALFQDTREYLEMLGILPNMLSNDKFKAIYNGQLADPFSRAHESVLEQMGLAMIRDCLSGFRGLHEQPGALEFLSMVDYMLDIFVIRKRLMKGGEIDLDKIHTENTGISDPLKYCELLTFKLRSAESM